ncbi:hypothetical protein [Streptomyces sp. NPDC001985]|uniref:hypothetical protein n=1 Tax=Streptomyces sp. NPDC001985 TaxID=3154406 RepID=UPI003329ECA3
MIRRAMAVTAATAALVLFAGSAAHAKSTETQLSNGILYFEATDGRYVSGNPSVFFSATQYKKTGGSTTQIQLALWTTTKLIKDDARSISAGQTKGKSWGGLPKASHAPDCKATGYMIASSGKYTTPTLTFC